ncbi:MAG: hypothetical protein NTV34_18285 [Proteobacteria bacterium]|nr:hypothetical protein [Pseudomonadota bacterium]
MPDLPKSELTASPAAQSERPTGLFREAIALMDDTTWIWGLSQWAFAKQACPLIRLPSVTTIRHSWARFKDAHCIVIHWESKGRSGGAIVEEILDVDPRYDIANKVIVLTSNPIHEDVVYFNELGLRRIIRIRNREKEIELSRSELTQSVAEAIQERPRPTIESLWRKVLAALDRLTQNPDPEILQKIKDNVIKLKGEAKASARDLDALGSISFLQEKKEEAFRDWNAALQANPNYFRTYSNMIAAHRHLGEHQEAYLLMQKMQMLNRSSISRLVAMGETQIALQDDRKAEHYFRSALEKDSWSSGALNGMAEIKFRQGELDTARDLLGKSNLSYRFAGLLNLQGIEMVKQGRYADALEHYSKAQYVLPQQEKGPQLFYNIGLCYSRWSKPNMAQEFLKLALIKEPNYKKAQRLLEKIHKLAAPQTKNAS